MSWAETFNSSAAGRRFSSEMPNIKLDSTISQAEINAKIKEHQKNQNKSDDSEKKSDTNSEINNAAENTQTVQNNGYNYQSYAQNPQTVQNNSAQYPQVTTSGGYNYALPQVQTVNYSYGCNSAPGAVNAQASQCATAPLYPNYNQYQGYAQCQPNIQQYQQYQGTQAPEQYAQTQSIQIPDYAIEAYKGTTQG